MQEPAAEELEQAAGNVDIVIHEGFKKNAKYKIEVFRDGVSGELPLCMDDSSYFALVSDKSFPVSIPLFDLNDATGVADFLIRNIKATSDHDANSDCNNMCSCS